MLGLDELELLALMMDGGMETCTLSESPKRAQLSEISKKVNRQLKGYRVFLRCFRNRVLVLKYPHVVKGGIIMQLRSFFKLLKMARKRRGERFVTITRHQKEIRVVTCQHAQSSHKQTGGQSINRPRNNLRN